MRDQIVIRKPENWFQIASSKRGSLVAEVTNFLCSHLASISVGIGIYTTTI